MHKIKVFFVCLMLSACSTQEVSPQPPIDEALAPYWETVLATLDSAGVVIPYKISVQFEEATAERLGGWGFENGYAIIYVSKGVKVESTIELVIWHELAHIYGFNHGDIAIIEPGYGATIEWTVKRTQWINEFINEIKNFPEV